MKNPHYHQQVELVAADNEGTEELIDTDEETEP
jgi:hypothetical protein